MGTNQKHANKIWLYDGKPEYLDIRVGAASQVGCGYVVALELADGTIRLAATRNPAKYITAWRYNVKRYGLPDVVRVLVSKSYLRYEAVKRGIASNLIEYKDENTDVYRLDARTLTEKAQEVLSVAGM
ncbi:hypothetical protein [Sulfuricystis multivorans]|uniref:hypothetical protein n=1 Tax=Sulfuricystis multivorans TaxID=2211108 RepID=UPI000F84A3E7|nr:hypothetical protein [Sulfuricystis multivorans]